MNQRYPKFPFLPGLSLIAYAILAFGCASAPTMPELEALAPDTQVAFGSAVVFVDDERQKWGMGWTGESHFYLLILPEGVSEAISYDLSSEGDFYWPLAPGSYVLLGYHWQKGNEQRGGDIRAEFLVPETGEDVYVGNLELRGNEYRLGWAITDDYAGARSAYEAKFPNRPGKSAKGLMETLAPPGTVRWIAPPCHESWQIECPDKYSGVTPLSPKVQSSGFTPIDSLSPEFRWRGSARDDVTYDLVIYEAAKYTTTGVVDAYAKGRMTVYVEGLEGTSWTPPTPLKPDTKYYWSVRLA